MIDLASAPELAELGNGLSRFFALAKSKIAAIDREYDESKGSPVFTVGGKYTTRGWTEWTEGFRYGIAILHFDATGDEESLASGRERTVRRMATHVSHIGVHDHGFNNLSTYGNLRRLMLEGRIAENEWESNFYELAIKTSGAVQAARWTVRQDGGFIHSFNGPHSLFVDTIRSCRILMKAHQLGHVLMAEGDKPVSLLGARAAAHRVHREVHPSSTARAAIPTTNAAAPPTRPSSTPPTAPTAARTRSRDTPDSPPGPAARPGPCSDLPRNSNCSTNSPTTNSPPSADATPSRIHDAQGRHRHRRSLHRKHPDLRRPLLGHRRAETSSVR